MPLQGEAFHVENEQIVQAANSQRPWSNWNKWLLKVEKRKLADFQAKKVAAEPVNRQSSRWLMWQTEENRLVFEGVVFDVEHKVTRTGVRFDQF